MGLRKDWQRLRTVRGFLLYFLCFFFLCGVFWGQLLQRRLCVNEELQTYLNTYLSVTEGGTDDRMDVLRLLYVYFRAPLLVLLFGFSALGCVLVPVIMGAQGFFLSFSLACFASSLGRKGILLGAAAFGFRCLTVVPCTLYLAAWAMERHGGRERREARNARSRSLRGAVLCILWLLLGAVLDHLLMPRLIGRILSMTI